MASLATADERIEHITSLMRSLAFKRGQTVKSLARQWGVPLSTVRGYANTASKIIRASFSDDKEENKAEMLLALDKAQSLAVASKDSKALILAAKVKGTCQGVYSERLSLHARISPQSVEALSDDALLWMSVFGESKPGVSKREAGFYVSTLNAHLEEIVRNLEALRPKAEKLDQENQDNE